MKEGIFERWTARTFNKCEVITFVIAFPENVQLRVTVSN